MINILHIYHGNGKGKTTAATGLAIRAAGADLKVCFVQFLKNGTSSEINILKQINNIEYLYCDKCGKFTFQMNDSEKALITSGNNLILEKAFGSDADVIILDEFLDVYNLDVVDRSSAEKYILNTNREIILTGRNPSEIFLDHADYISEIKSVCHPYEKGIRARRGIEY